MQNYTYIIIGSSAAGISAINQLARLDPIASILCVSASKESPYNTCFLVDVLAQTKRADEIALRTIGQNITWKLSTKVISIDRSKKSIIASDNSEILYQKLLITTGVRSYLPPIEGITTPGVFTFHTLADVHAIDAWIMHQQVRTAVVIGAGLTGIECADALYMRGIAVTIIEQQVYCLNSHLTQEGAQFVMEQMEAAGVSLYCNSTVQCIIPHQNVIAVCLTNGREIVADMVIIAAGVKPQSELYHETGLVMHKNYLVVSDTMQTSDPFIFAAGDGVIVHNKMQCPSFIWVHAAQQGMCAAYAMAGQTKSYEVPSSWITSRFFGLNFGMIGAKEMEGDRVIEKKKTRDMSELYFITISLLVLSVLMSTMSKLRYFAKWYSYKSPIIFLMTGE